MMLRRSTSFPADRSSQKRLRLGVGGGFLLGAFPQSYAIICGWAAVSAAVHLLRSFGFVCSGRRVVGSRV